MNENLMRTQAPVGKLLGKGLDTDALHQMKLPRTIKVQNGFKVAR